MTITREKVEAEEIDMVLWPWRGAQWVRPWREIDHTCTDNLAVYRLSYGQLQERSKYDESDSQWCDV